ncbi:hypothetical protein ES319_D01G019300v1 [Gossypium barbadense]|uniref:Uncharacterized protein n=2 Tax=Gossypium TaxID=3633 RepID=A0A5J5SMG8_GOSBA|nr:hypothetical protein ES319_D01G019300v1 [Gossypium barbadense]KAB2043462.1 hypothetical protein ES319_D01G019300v1 [Gossypium barbadense]KAB2043464.1 hypothetical protein ES319_D01G019300v1 [Gossypium barbadense]TYG81638.1 hypothetical protein ES288_D01G021500v1 [Gossypium darwinii]
MTLLYTGWLGLLMQREQISFLFRNCLRVISFVKHKGRISFGVLSLIMITLPLKEVITSAEFHPTHCNMLAYSSSKGSIRLIDLRQLVLCDSHAKLQVFYRF